MIERGGRPEGVRVFVNRRIFHIGNCLLGGRPRRADEVGGFIEWGLMAIRRVYVRQI